MRSDPGEHSDDEYFDCLSEVRYCAVASPQGHGSGEVFVDFKKAQSRWKQIRGSRMKVFDNFAQAQIFADTPIKDNPPDVTFPPSPKADVESTPFSSVPHSSLLQLRKFLENGNLEKIRSMIDENPMSLVTSSDTPTLLQIRLRYNALHVAAASGITTATELILGYINSMDFWRRIYPGTDEKTTMERQWRVTDLYLNSPELGNLETPLHFASKFGHTACVRILAAHPLTQVNLVNRAGQTALDVAASRVSEGEQAQNVPNGTVSVLARSHSASDAVARVLDEYYVVLADVSSPRLSTQRICVLPALSLHQLQSILAQLVPQPPPGLRTLMPFLHVQLSRSGHLAGDQADSRAHSGAPGLMTRVCGVHGSIRSVRAFAGPMLLSEANAFRLKWTKANSSIHSKAFASIRLSDCEKGYERQGRYFARLFGTQWFEYWSFLDDFLDLASENGLNVFDTLLRQGKLNCFSSPSPLDTLQPDMHFYSTSMFGLDEIPPSTPIRQQDADDTNCSAAVFSTEDVWTAYRPQSALCNLLDDSLDQSIDSCETQIHFTENNTEKDVTNTSQPIPGVFSPLACLLEKLTFVSPFRWLSSSRTRISEDHSLSLSLNNETNSPLSSNLTNSPGKRKHHELERRTSTTSSDQPVSKKASSGSNTERSSRSTVVPVLYRQICHALPGGDPEVDTAVAILCQPGVKRSEPSSKDNWQPWALCHHSPSLLKFPLVAAWKSRVETAVHFDRKPRDF